MRKFAANIAIAIVWMAASGFWSGLGLLSGMLLGIVLLSLLPGGGSIRYGTRIFRLVRLGLVFIREFALSVIRVAITVVRPRMQISPHFFEYPLMVKSDLEITLLANLITLTPGTMTVDVSEDRQSLLVHALDSPDIEKAKAEIRNGFERLIREAFET